MTSLRVLGQTESFGLRSNSQSFLPDLRLVAAHPAVALADHDLHGVANLSDRGRRPLAVQDLLAGGRVLPHQLPGRLVERDDRGRLRRGHVDVALVLAVRRADVEQVLEHDGRGVRHVVLHHAELVHHVVAPDDVGVGLARLLLVLERAVVLALVAESLDVDRHHLAAVRHVVRDAILDERRRAHALEGPVVRAARRQLVVHRLPEELAVGLAEGHQDALVSLDRRILHRFVVRAHEHDAVGDDRVAVGLRPELRDPLDVLLRLDVPARRQPLHARNEIAIGRAAPHRPVALAGIGTRDRGRDPERTSESIQREG